MALFGAFILACAIPALVLNGLAQLSVLMLSLVGLLAYILVSQKLADEKARAENNENRNRELSEQLDRDPLTGHLNRLAFTRCLSQLARAKSDNTMIILLFFDLNKFKEVNDTLGHDIGDALLIEVGKRAEQVLGDAIAVARLGGDEFAAILPYKDENATRSIAETLVTHLGKPYRLNERHVEVSASVGLAVGDPAIHGGEELLRRADLAMYEVKGFSSGAFHIFDDLLSNRQARESLIRTELGKSDFEKRFILHYQPIFDAREGHVAKVEALLRTKEGEKLAGIGPSQMVSVAEDSGLIVELTDWTIRTALDAATDIDLPVAVNVSPLYFRHPNFADRVIELLIEAQACPSFLVIEITESVLIADIPTAKESIDYLRAVGVKVYLDDFGTGFSSLSYLQNFELDGIKLDRTFIQGVGKANKSSRIVRSMIDFSHSLNMKAVVEGVESEWQARMLQMQGCDYLQGFDLGLPMPLEELRAFLDTKATEADEADEADEERLPSHG